MIVWTKNFPKKKKIFGYIRLLKARYRFFDRYRIRIKGFRLKIEKIEGYQSQLKRWADKYKGKRCFIIGNGPSLKKMDLSVLKDEITIGFNGIYKLFDELGFSTDYLLFEDIEQTELRGPELHKIKGPIKIASIYNSYAIPKCFNDFIFMNVRLADGYYWKKLKVLFSKDFPNIVYLGSTITYIGLQLAYYLGFDEVYLIGVDHNYGELPKLFPPGKIKITEDNIDIVNKLHFSEKYYKIGDLIGVPHVEYQELAYSRAREAFESDGRKIFNAGIDSELKIFKKCNFNKLFSK